MTTEPARSTPMAMLKTRWARGVRSSHCTLAPNASHTKQHGSEASTNSPPSAVAWADALPDPVCRYVPAALAQTSHD